MSQQPDLHTISLQYQVHASKQGNPAIKLLPLRPPGTKSNVNGPKPAV